jgi:hypothetical protein
MPMPHASQMPCADELSMLDLILHVDAQGCQARGARYVRRRSVATNDANQRAVKSQLTRHTRRYSDCRRKFELNFNTVRFQPPSPWACVGPPRYARSTKSTARSVAARRRPSVRHESQAPLSESVDCSGQSVTMKASV